MDFFLQHCGTNIKKNAEEKRKAYRNAQKFNIVSPVSKSQKKKNDEQIENLKREQNQFERKNQFEYRDFASDSYEVSNDLKNELAKLKRQRSRFKASLSLIDQNQEVAAAKLKDKINALFELKSEKEIRAGIENTLTELLDGSDNKTKKIELLQRNVLTDQKVRALKKNDWIEIIDSILLDIYRYIDTDSSEGQDILNLFFIAFNKYTGKADKNQAFTPDHITEFMCRLTEVDHTKRVLDGTCGSASFLVQAMVKELADCRKGHTEAEAKALQKKVKEKNIFGIEVEEKAFGLSVTNMLIHGEGNSNIKLGSCFDHKAFIATADPHIILMNPPYNAKPIGIPNSYKDSWTAEQKKGTADPTKGLVFVRYFSDVIKSLNDKRKANGEEVKTVKLAVLLPLACAIGTGKQITNEKRLLLENNTLEAVFSLPAEMFYPGASVCACCMLFTLGQPHVKPDGTTRSTFFGYCKDDGFVKKKNLGRVEQFDEEGNSKWKAIEDEWLDLFERKAREDGKSAVEKVDGDDEWLCEAYMKTDYTKLTAADFQRTLNNYLSYLVKEGNVYESSDSCVDGDE